MTDHTVRLYALVVAVLVLVLAWATVAARPWAAQDPRPAALAQRAQMLRAEARLVQLVADARAAAARSRPAQTSGTSTVAAAAPAVRVVNLPPLTITRTS